MANLEQIGMFIILLTRRVFVYIRWQIKSNSYLLNLLCVHFKCFQALPLITLTPVYTIVDIYTTIAMASFK